MAMDGNHRDPSPLVDDGDIESARKKERTGGKGDLDEEGTNEKQRRGRDIGLVTFGGCCNVVGFAHTHGGLMESFVRVLLAR